MQNQATNVIYLSDFRSEEVPPEQEAKDASSPRNWAFEVQQLRLQRTVLLIAVVVLFAIAVLGG